MLDVDVLGVQEVERRVIRSWFADQPAQIARALGAAGTVRYAPARRFAVIGSDGVALCVSGVIQKTRIVELPRENAVQRRVAVIARAVVGDVVMTAATTHLHNDAPVARRQLEALLDELSTEPAPRLLLGDLNLRPEDVASPLRAAGFATVEAGPTEPAWAPMQRIDHIALDGFGAGTVSVPAVPVSDHRPLVVEVRPESRPRP